MIKENINKIDFDLKGLFESVEISEKSNKSNYYFEINASAKKAKVKVEISKPDLSGNVVRWSYYTNPINESSEKIERVSNIEKIANDIFEVITKRKMDSSYFESLEADQIEMVNESLINESSVTEEEKIELEKKLEEILKRFEIEERLTKESKYDENVMVKTMTFRKSLKPTDLYLLDMNLKTAGFNNVEYSGDVIKIQFYA